MGLLILFFFVAVIAAPIAIVVSSPEVAKGNAIFSFVLVVVIGMMFCSVWRFFSWVNYVAMAQTYVSVKTCEDEAKLYVSKGMTEPTTGVADQTLTDLRYNMYQEELSRKLKNMKDEIVKYNDMLIGKRILLKSFMIGPILTVPPDPDMEIYEIDWK